MERSLIVIRRRASAVFLALLIAAGAILIGARADAAGPNYCTSKEHLQLYYDGYVQVQASYSDAGRHAKNGWLQYRIPGVADSGQQYTPDTPSRWSKAVKSKSYRFWDSWDWSVPPTEFNCGYNWW